LLGLPAGAILGGLLAAQLLPVIGWEGIYVVGGVAPLALLIVLFFILPESMQYLANDKKRNNTEKIRMLINRIVKQPIINAATFTVPEPEVKSGISSLFTAGLARNTIAIWTIYLFNWIAWFMLLSWLPTVLRTAGLSDGNAPMGTVTVNAVFILCAIPLAILLPRINTKSLLFFMFIFGILLSIGLAYSGTNWTWVFILAGAGGLGIGGQQIVLNYMVAQSYPTSLRATATGWAIAIGRIGAIVGSASGGWVLESFGISGYYLSLALPLAIATIALLIIKPNTNKTAIT
ncbi:MAG: MFS transporter, partial [Alcaligenaceae bacterium]|nr:MFS transporter [Alcaligenaceae bacterium]